jgi:hypothetical protein
LSSSDVLADVQPPEALAIASHSHTERHAESAASIVEAQGWRVDEEGKVLLIAEATGSLASTSCQIP